MSKSSGEYNEELFRLGSANTIQIPATEETLRSVAVGGAPPATNEVIYNVTMNLQSTEYSQTLPANVKAFEIKCRGANPIQLSFTAGQSNTNFITIPANSAYYVDRLNIPSLTLYFQCRTAAGQVAEIVAWS